MPNTYTMHDGKRIGMTADAVGVADGAPEWAKQQWNVTLRHGRRRMSFPFYGGGAASDPTADDVVESLILDGSASSASFEDWCADYGLDTDSRSDLATYRACRRLGERFARLLA
jgi:hypothetical protein